MYEYFVGIDVGGTYAGVAVLEVELSETRHAMAQQFIHVTTDQVWTFIDPSVGKVGALDLRPAFGKILLMNQQEWASPQSDPVIVNHVVECHSGQTDLRSGAMLISEVIARLWAIAVENIPRARVGEAKVHAVITHPVTWLPDTMQRFKEAIALSKIGQDASSVLLLSESHAATRAVTVDFQEKLHKSADPIVVADCGGITIDTALYEPEKLLVSGARTRFYGMLSLNLRYYTAIQDVLQGHAATTGRNAEAAAVTATEILAMLQWEYRGGKCAFRPDVRQSAGPWFPTPDGQPVQVHRDVLLKAYKDLADKIVEMIMLYFNPDSVSNSSKPKEVYFTGGLCVFTQLLPVVQNELTTLLGEDAPKLVLGDRDNMLSAVCRGAALHAAFPLAEAW